MAEALLMKNIVKVYSNGVMANKDVTLQVNKGEIHALSGENGAGKSTLMKILFGEEQATSGEIYINGEKVDITNPQMAIELGIGMVHQHFMLVPSLSVTENMIMGVEPKKGIFIDEKYARQQVEEIGRKYNLYIDPDKKIADLTVGQKQKVEILKALFRGAKILILDEPTAVLTPQETAELFVELKHLKENGYTIIFISHKLNEVKELCDRITIIRRGVTMGVHNVAEVSEEDISRLMVGRDVVLKIEKKPAQPGSALLQVKNLKIADATGAVQVNGVSFSLREGEILGIAGVEGNGQTQLINAITGMGHVSSGSITLGGNDITGSGVRKIRGMGLGHIPEDRMTSGVAPNLSITENVISDKLGWKKFVKFGLLNLKAIRSYGEQMVKDYQILCKSQDVEIGSLSGGNIQKGVVARELSSDPRVVIANQPTRGVDVGASEFIRQQLINMRDQNKGILLITSDLNEVLGLADSLIVMYEGKIVAYISDVASMTESELGTYMLGIKKQTAEEIKEAIHEA
jgi:simple sugar transport system ATP-binding protein